MSGRPAGASGRHRWTIAALMLLLVIAGAARDVRADDGLVGEPRVWLLPLDAGAAPLGHVLDAVGGGDVPAAVVRSWWAAWRAELNAINAALAAETRADRAALDALLVELDPVVAMMKRRASGTARGGSDPPPDDVSDDDPRWDEMSAVHDRIKAAQRPARQRAHQSLDAALPALARALELDDLETQSLRALIRREVINGGMARREIPSSPNARIHDLVSTLRHAAPPEPEWFDARDIVPLLQRRSTVTDAERAIVEIVVTWEIELDTWFDHYLSSRETAVRTDAPRGLAYDDPRAIELRRRSTRLGAAERRLFRHAANAIAGVLEAHHGSTCATRWRERCAEVLTPELFMTPWPLHASVWLADRAEGRDEQVAAVTESLERFTAAWNAARDRAPQSQLLAWDAPPEREQRATERSVRDRVALHRLTRDWIAEFVGLLDEPQRVALFDLLHDRVGRARRDVTGPRVSVRWLRRTGVFEEVVAPLFGERGR